MKLTEEEKKERRREYDHKRYLRLRPEPVYPKPPRDTSNRPTRYKKRISTTKTITIDFDPDLMYEQQNEQIPTTPLPRTIYGETFNDLALRFFGLNTGDNLEKTR